MDAAIFLLIMLAFLSVGKIVTRKIWRLEFASSTEEFVFSSALGSVVTSVMIAGLAFIGQVSSTTCWALLIFLLTTSLSFLKEVKHWNFKASLIFFPLSPLKTSIQFILGILVLLSLSLALAPAFATDALVYHLAVPKAYLEAGGIINLPNNFYSFFPQQIEMLYLFALALGSDSLAQLTGLGIVFILLISLWQYYRIKGSSIYAWLVPLVFISTPTFFSISPSAYVDLQAATYVFLTYYAWENGCTRNQPRWIFLMTLFAGAAVATKLTTVIILPLALLGLAVHGRSHKKASQVAGQCLLLVLGSLMLILPWLAKNYFYTGNPFAPFFMPFFGGESGMNWDISRSQQQFQYYSSFGMGHSILDFFMLPINLTFFGQSHSLKFDGQIGILYLLLLPALFGLTRKSQSMIIVLLVLLVFWFIQTQYIRLLAPAFTFLSVLLVLGLEQGIQKHGPLVGKKEKIFLSIILSLGLLFNVSIITKEWSRINPIPYLLNKEYRHQFLTRQIKAYPLYLAANQMTEPENKIFLVYMSDAHRLQLFYDIYGINLFVDDFFQSVVFKKSIAIKWPIH